MNIKSIRDRLKSKRDELDRLIASTGSNPSVVKARVAYNEAGMVLDKAIADANEVIKDNVLELRKEVNLIDQELENELEKKEYIISPSIQEYIRKLNIGVDYGYKGLIVKWVSSDERFIIITVSGGSYCSGMYRSYGKAQHYLLDLSKFSDGDSGYGNLKKCEIFEREGRLGKDTKEMWIKYTNEAKNENK